MMVKWFSWNDFYISPIHVNCECKHKMQILSILNYLRADDANRIEFHIITMVTFVSCEHNSAHQINSITNISALTLMVY